MSRSCRSHRLRSFLSAALTGVFAQAVMAGDCAPIVKAINATLKAPVYRQYRYFPGRGERLFGIALGDTVYIAIGGSNGWQKMDRKDNIAIATRAEEDTAYRECKWLGSDLVNGVATAVYEYTVDSKGSGAGGLPAKVWIGPDGLLRKQGAKASTMRYEYDNVKAPIPR